MHIFKIILIIIIAILVVLTILYFVFDDSKLIIWYLFDKNNFRYKMLRKYQRENKVIYVLGTIHDMHFKFQEYSFLHLNAVLKNLNPDILMIETRPEEIKLNNFLDGPIEMFYLHMIAKNMNIHVKGIDWWNPEDCQPGTTNKTRDKHIIDNVESNIGSYNKPLVVFGGTHMLNGEKLLKRRGFKRQKLSKKEMDNFFTLTGEEFYFSRDIKNYIDIRIKRDEELLKVPNLSDKWINSIQFNIKNLKKFKIDIDEQKYKIEKD